MDQVLAATGIIGLFGSAGVVLMQLLRQNARLNKSQQTDIESLRQANKDCERRLNIVIVACRDAGITVPNEVWQ